MTKRLSDFKALSFDVYGTLVDWESGIYKALESLLQRANSSWTKDEAIQAYLKEEHVLEEENPTMLYSTLLSKVYERLATRLGTTCTADEARAFGESIRVWQPFPDTVDALARLSKHYVLMPLSNVDLESFSYTRKLLEHGFQFNKVMTAQEIGSYKPDEKNFLYMLNVAKTEFGVEKNQVLVTANSLWHDHAPANKLGIASSWISRSVPPESAGEVRYDFRFTTLGDMADALEKESSSDA